ncbi:MAG TPA: hypothetical protein VKF42_10680 [Chitinivibrionales bacterium]|jgi:hypothetical protein|nr:hypothetical protein [Chitinivibrionales bacterium]
MKLPPHATDLRKLLGPSRFSADGFLGSDKRSPEDIIHDDIATLARVGIDKSRLVEALRTACAAAERALGRPVPIAARVSAVSRDWRGRTPSPFPGEGTFAKGETIFSNDTTGASFSVSPLSLHLIDKHGFFQGRGSPYRVEPEVAARMMGMLRS